MSDKDRLYLIAICAAWIRHRSISGLAYGTHGPNAESIFMIATTQPSPVINLRELLNAAKACGVFPESVTELELRQAWGLL